MQENAANVTPIYDIIRYRKKKSQKLLLYFTFTSFDSTREGAKSSFDLYMT